MKDVLIYEEKYRKGSMKVNPGYLPECLPIHTEGTKIVEMEMRAAGEVERNGERLEYQDLRVYVKPPKKEAEQGSG